MTGDNIFDEIAVQKKVQQENTAKINRETDEYVESKKLDEKDITLEVEEYARINTEGEKARIAAKLKLANYVEEYEDYASGDEELTEIFAEVKKYASKNVTAGSDKSDYRDEVSNMRNIENLLAKYQKRLDAEALDGEHDTLSDYARQHAVSGLIWEFERMEGGDLVNDDPESNAINIRYTEKIKAAEKYKDDFNFEGYDDKPLFPHEPCANDIVQGYLGDCYFVASLAGIADRNPEKIREMMRDNNDGTVTVKFYQTKKNEQGEDVYTPLLVTVDKTVPIDKYTHDDEYAQHSLWVQVFERAYAASGLRVEAKTRREKTWAEIQAERKARNENTILTVKNENENPWHNKYVRPVPENIDQMYDDIKSGKTPMPSHKECPWLVDEEGKLHEWQPSYGDIEGGNAVDVIRDVFGPEYDCRRYDIKTDGKYFFNDDGKIDPKGIMTMLRHEAAKEDEALSDENIKKYDEGIANVMSMGRFFFGETINYDIPFSAGASQISPIDNAKVLLSNDLNYAIQKGFKNIELSGNREEDLKRAKEAFEDISAKAKKGLDKRMEEDGLSDKFEYVTKRIDAMKELCNDYMEKNIDKMYLERHYWEEKKPYSGEYNGNAEFIFDKINSITGPGNVVFAGTLKNEKKEPMPGIRVPHEYTVMGTDEKVVGGKKLKFVRLRNPHGQNIVEYKPSDDGTTLVPTDAQAKSSEGYFDIELNDFIKEFSDLDYTKVNQKTRAIEEEKRRLEQKDNEIIDKSAPADIQKTRDESEARVSYDKLLEDVSKNLKATHSFFSDDSKEFKDMEKAVKAARTALLQGGPDSAAKIDAAFAELGQRTQGYLDHCAKEQKTGSRRAERMQIANSLKSVITMKKDGEMHPTARIKNEAANKVFDAYKDVAQNDPKQAMFIKKLSDPKVKEVALKNYISSSGFKTSIGKDYVKMLNTMQKPKKEIEILAKKVMSPAATEDKTKKFQEKTQSKGRGGLF